MRGGFWALLLILWAAPGLAQPVLGEGVIPPWSASQQRAAEILSHATLASVIALDTLDSWRADDRRAAFALEAARLGSVWLATRLLKSALDRMRPCAPACGLEDAAASFPSGHTAFAASAVGGAPLVVTLPLSASTGYFRIMAWKHWLTDTLAGWVIGAAVGQWLR